MSSHDPWTARVAAGARRLEPNVPAVVHDVEVLSEALERDRAVLTCCVGQRRFVVPRYFVHPSSHVHKPGDRGRLVVPHWLAAALGLVSET